MIQPSATALMPPPPFMQQSEALTSSILTSLGQDVPSPPSPQCQWHAGRSLTSSILTSLGQDVAVMRCGKTSEKFCSTAVQRGPGRGCRRRRSRKGGIEEMQASERRGAGYRGEGMHERMLHGHAPMPPGQSHLAS